MHLSHNKILISINQHYFLVFLVFLFFFFSFGFLGFLGCGGCICGDEVEVGRFCCPCGSSSFCL